MADDARTGAVRSVEAACALRRDSADELDLAHDLHRLAAGRIVERAAFHEHGADDPVAAARVGQELVECVVGGEANRFEKRMKRFGERAEQRAQIPQVVVRVDDRQVGFDDRFGRGHAVSLVRMAQRPGVSAKLVARGFRLGINRMGGTAARAVSPFAFCGRSLVCILSPVSSV